MSNKKSKLNISKQLGPTPMEIELFAKDLLENIQEIIDFLGEKPSRNFEKAKLQFEGVIINLKETWSNLIKFEIIDSVKRGQNFVFKGPTDPYLIPDLFWSGRNPLKINIRSFRKWIDNFPVNINWDEFQIHLFEMFYDEKISHLGITKRHLEIIKFYARINIDYPNFANKISPKRRKELFSIYKPNYEKEITYTQLNKDYKSVINQYAQDDAVPLPIPWKLDCLVVHPHTNYDQAEVINSLPIWTLKSFNNNEEINFAIHKIEANSINSTDQLYDGLVKKIHFFWNLNHYLFKKTDTKKSRCDLILSSPKILFKAFEDQNYTLIDTFSNSNIDYIDKIKIERSVYSPDWQLDLHFPSFNTVVSSKSKEKDINISSNIIKMFNLRRVDENSLFFKQYEQESSKYIFDRLFGNRLYFMKLPPSIRGIIWIPIHISTDRDKLKIIIPFLTAWLHRGPIIEYNSGLLIISYFSQSQMTKSFIKEINEFFNSFDLEIYLFLPNIIKSTTSFSIYSLPESYYFDEENQNWYLPKRNLIPSSEEKISIINQIKENEIKSH